MFEKVFWGFCVWLALLGCAGDASAQEFRLGESKPPEEPVQVLVNVRTVKADRGMTAVPAGSEGNGLVLIDGRLSDLSARLKKLPFQSFKLLSAERRLIPLKKRDSIALSGGHVLTLRPLYIENEKVGVWLKWQDKNGADILDTRLHFDCNESMLAGTDATDETGLILAIDVKKQ